MYLENQNVLQFGMDGIRYYRAALQALCSDFIATSNMYHEASVHVEPEVVQNLFVVP